MPKTKVKTTISIDEDLYKEIADNAKKEERSFSRELTYLLKKCIGQGTKLQGLTK